MKVSELSRKERRRVYQGFFKALLDFVREENVREDFERFFADNAEEYGFRDNGREIELVSDRW